MIDIFSIQGWGIGIFQLWGEGVWEIVGGLLGEYGNWVFKRGLYS